MKKVEWTHALALISVFIVGIVVGAFVSNVGEEQIAFDAGVCFAYMTEAGTDQEIAKLKCSDEEFRSLILDMPIQPPDHNWEY